VYRCAIARLRGRASVVAEDVFVGGSGEPGAGRRCRRRRSPRARRAGCTSRGLVVEHRHEGCGPTLELDVERPRQARRRNARDRCPVPRSADHASGSWHRLLEPGERGRQIVPHRNVKMRWVHRVVVSTRPSARGGGGARRGIPAGQSQQGQGRRSHANAMA
jgi:hypothetical protein